LVIEAKIGVNPPELEGFKLGGRSLEKMEAGSFFLILLQVL